MIFCLAVVLLDNGHAKILPIIEVGKNFYAI